MMLVFAAPFIESSVAEVLACRIVATAVRTVSPHLTFPFRVSMSNAFFFSVSLTPG